jgi:lauroyl/myristoyl acyltransferase
VAILIDQHLHTPEAVYVDYFGRPAATTSRRRRCALRTGAVVIPGLRAAAARRPLPLHLRASGGAAAARFARPVLEFTQRCTDVLEMYVRRPS